MTAISLSTSNDDGQVAHFGTGIVSVAFGSKLQMSVRSPVLLLLTDSLGRMMDISSWFSTSWGSLPLILASTLAVYASLILLTRVVGLRSFSKMSSFDFAMTIATGSVVATTILSKSPTVAQGLAALASIFSLQFIVALARRKSDTFASVVDNEPVLLMKDGEVLEPALDETRVTRSDLWEKLREANCMKTDQVRAVVLESTGDISVLHSSEDIAIDDCLLQDVRMHAS